MNKKMSINEKKMPKRKDFTILDENELKRTINIKNRKYTKILNYYLNFSKYYIKL